MSENKSRYKVILSDVDGTIVNNEPRNRGAIETVSRVGGHIIKKDDWNVLAGKGDSIIWELIAKESPSLTEVFTTANTFEIACLNEKINRIDEVQKIPEVIKAFKLFRNKDLPIAAVSNSVANDAMASLRHVGYSEDDFITTLFRDEVQRIGLKPKPYPDPYLEALKRVNALLEEGALSAETPFELIRPDQCIVLEDSGNGVRAGLAAGMTVIQMIDESPALDRSEIEQAKAKYNCEYSHFN